MAFRHWYCEWCGEEGTVRHKKNAGVYEVHTAIGAHHRRKFEACAEMNGTECVRLGVPSAAWRRKAKERVVVRTAS